MNVSTIARTGAKNTGTFTREVLTWNWTKKLLTWLIISAGTMSECVFIIASLWICINASVHSFVLLFMPDSFARMLTSLADTAYVGLPELILPLAIVTTISHFRLWFSQKKSVQPLIWLCMFGLPTLVFLSISIATLGFSLASVGFELPLPFVIVRGISGYWYAIASILYIKLGEPQERDRLQERDNTIAALRRESERNLSTLRQEHAVNLASLRNEKDTQIIEAQKQINLLTEELARANAAVESEQKQKASLANELNNASEDALEAYSEECKIWLADGAKTVSIDSIIQFTGHSKRAINQAIKVGKLQTHSRNHELVLKQTLVRWLEATPPPTSKSELDLQKFIPFPLERVGSNGNGMH